LAEALNATLPGTKEEEYEEGEKKGAAKEEK
jgi:hypothetical protein